MSREAKIGMLTGLFVIVLIGVLLSEYLGNSTAPAAGGRSLAADSAGDKLRKQQVAPVGVPGLVRDNVANALVTTPGDALPGKELPKALAVESGVGAAGPVIQPPAVAVAVADTKVMAPPAKSAITTQDLTGETPNSGGGVQPVVFVSAGEAKRAELAKQTEAVKIAATQPMVEKVAATQPTSRNETYVISAKDTLTIIAKKFYGTASKADRAKIIAANSGTLKDDSSMLVVGRKLTIPNVPIKAEIAKAPGDSKTAVAKGIDGAKLPLVVKPPVGAGGVAIGDGGLDPKLFERVEAPKSADKALQIYVVQKSDTLERIAKKVSTKDCTVLVKQIESANGLKPGAVLQVGQKLKMPVVAKPIELAHAGL